MNVVLTNRPIYIYVLSEAYVHVCMSVCALVSIPCNIHMPSLRGTLQLCSLLARCVGQSAIMHCSDEDGAMTHRFSTIRNWKMSATC